MKVISFASNKGGVSKTTSTINVGAILSSIFEKKVLLIDFDPQSSLTIYMGIDPLSLKNTAYEVLVSKCNIKDAILATNINNLHILPSSIVLSAGEVEIMSKIGKEFILKDKIKELKNVYDYILIDNMPSLGSLTINSLIASDYYIAPTEASYLALKGLEILFSTVEEVKRLNNDIKFLGVLVAKYKKNTNHQKEVLSTLQNKYKVFESIIYNSVKFEDSVLACKSIIDFSGKGFEGSRSYIKIVEEILGYE